MLVFEHNVALEDAIAFHTFAPLDALACVATGILLGWLLLLPVGTVNCIETLKVYTAIPARSEHQPHSKGTASMGDG